MKLSKYNLHAEFDICHSYSGQENSVKIEEVTHGYMHAYTNIHTHAHAQTPMQQHTHACTNIHAHAQTYPCMHKHTHPCTNIHTHAQTYMPMHTHTRPCTNIDMQLFQKHTRHLRQCMHNWILDHPRRMVLVVLETAAYAANNWTFVNLHRPMLLTTRSHPRGSYRTHTFETTYPCPDHVGPTGPILLKQLIPVPTTWVLQDPYF